MIDNWCKLNNMQINIEKSLVLHFGKGNPNTEYSIGGGKLRSCCEAKDLGLLVDNSLKFTGHIRSVKSRASYISNMLFKAIP